MMNRMNAEDSGDQDKIQEIPKERNDASGTSTPTLRHSFNDEECSSPVLFRCTQDGVDGEMDVIWEWNSPQHKSSRNINRKKRPARSPEIKIRPKLFCSPKFTMLKAELEAFVNMMEKSKEKTCGETESTMNVEPKIDDLCPVNPENNNNMCTMLDDDSLDDEMFRCSQQVEAAFLEISKDSCGSPVTKKESAIDLADDSFDVILEEMDDNEVNLLSQGITVTTPVCKPIVHNSPRAIIRTSSAPIVPIVSERTSTFQRTKSVNCMDQPNTIQPQYSPNEIELKRLEAKARLQEKKHREEIERKRLKALETLNRNRMMRNAQKN